VHEYSFLQILAWWLDGIWRHVLTTTGLTWLLPENESPPGFWYIWFSWWDWTWNLSESGKVNKTITRNWLWACHRLWGNWTDEVGEYAKTSAVNLVKLWQIAAGSDVFNIQTWFGVLVAWLGSRSLSWASDVTDALVTLRGWLPHQVYLGYKTFEDLFRDIKESVKRWAIGRFDDAVTWATDAWNWVIVTGNALKTWYDTAHTWLDDFRNNAVTRVTSWLGTPWAILSGLAEDLRIFYNTVWSPWRERLVEFISDPLTYIYDRAEDYLCAKW